MNTGQQRLLRLGIRPEVTWDVWEKTAQAAIDRENEAELKAALNNDGATQPKPPPASTKPPPTQEDLERFYAKQMLRYSNRTAPFPQPMAEDAYHGVAADVVDILDPTTEASREAMLVQFLICAGNRIGRAAVLKHAGLHFCNDYCVLVGETNSARKGTALNVILNVFETFAPKWAERVKTGIQSGEGIIHAARDDVKTFNARTGQPCVIKGEDDKRILLIEEEFVRVMTVCGRKDSTLGWVLNEVWDARKRLATTSKSNSERATGVHGSLIGHITPTTLQFKIAKAEIEGGFANRFLWVAVQGKPDPIYDAPWIDWTQYPDIAATFDGLEGFCQPYESPDQGAAPVMREVIWSPEAKKLWREFYKERRKPAQAKSTWLEYILQRASAHVLRLTLVYTVLDGTAIITEEHIKAGLAVWDYCKRSAIWIFGYRTESTDADKIRWELERSETGLMRSQISVQVFNNHASVSRIDQALTILLNAGLARMEVRHENDKTVTVFLASEPSG